MWRRGKLKHLEENPENIFITCKGANILKQNVKSINTNHEKKILNIKIKLKLMFAFQKIPI